MGNKKGDPLDRPSKGYEDRLPILQGPCPSDDFPKCRNSTRCTSNVFLHIHAYDRK